MLLSSVRKPELERMDRKQIIMIENRNKENENSGKIKAFLKLVLLFPQILQYHNI